MLIGSKRCLEDNENWKNKVYRNAVNVYCRLQKEIFPVEHGIGADILISFTIFSVYYSDPVF